MKELRALGLTSYESSVYKTVLQFGRSNAKSIASRSRVPITALYPNLKSLVAKGFLQEIEKEVLYFEAVNPGLAIPSYIEKEQKRLKELQESVVPSLETLYQSKTLEKEREVVTVSSGIELSANITAEIMEATQKNIYIVGWGFRKKGKIYTIFHRLKKLAKNNVDVRLILTHTALFNDPSLKEFFKAGIKAKYLPLRDFSIVTSDQVRCKITIKSGDLKDRVNMDIHDPALSKAMHDYFLTLWKQAKKVP